MEQYERPWERLQELLKTEDPDQVNHFLKELKVEEVIRLMSRISREEQQALLTLLSPKDAAEIMEEIPDGQVADMIGHLDVENAAAILNKMKSDDQVDVLTEMEKDDAESIIAEMEPEEVLDVRRLIQFDPDTAGGLMITEFLAFDENKTVMEVADELRENAEEFEGYHVQYIYVISHEGFVGVLQMRDLLLSQPETPLSEIVLRDTLTVKDSTKLEELISFFDKYDFYGVPVLDENDQLVGVVLRKHILEAETERASIEMLETQGIVGGEELRTMPVLQRSKRRLSWLSVNIILNIIAASVIAFYQDTLSSVIALAVFLPIISDMSGCSGNQAVAVSMRELSLGIVKPFEVIRVWLQEVSVGMLNGLVLGLLIGGAALIWKGNLYLGLVVGGALGINTIIAVSIGGTVPLMLRRFGVDPALASGPILTTITDMIGFFLTLSFATMALEYIVV